MNNLSIRSSLAAEAAWRRTPGRRSISCGHRCSAGRCLGASCSTTAAAATTPRLNYAAAAVPLLSVWARVKPCAVVGLHDREVFLSIRPGRLEPRRRPLVRPVLALRICVVASGRWQAVRSLKNLGKSRGRTSPDFLQLLACSSNIISTRTSVDSRLLTVSDP